MLTIFEGQNANNAHLFGSREDKTCDQRGPESRQCEPSHLVLVAVKALWFPVKFIQLYLRVGNSDLYVRVGDVNVRVYVDCMSTSLCYPRTKPRQIKGEVWVGELSNLGVTDGDIYDVVRH